MSQQACVLPMENVFAFVLAGGKGSRLSPLTDRMSKPAIQIASKYRLADFAMSNIVNSGIPRTVLLTQYGNFPLQAHLEKLGLSNPVYGQSVMAMSPQMYGTNSLYSGTANAVFQGMEQLDQQNQIDTVDHIVIASGDHIYNLDFRIMLSNHIKNGADFSVCGIWVTPEEAQHFGTMHVNEIGEIIGFVEKPSLKIAQEMSLNDMCFVSMGIYIVDKDFLKSELAKDHKNKKSSHDFGKDIIPHIVQKKSGTIIAYDFKSHVIDGENGPYWEDVGRLSTLMKANMDQTGYNPYLNIRNPNWPLLMTGDRQPPAKVNHPDGGYLVAGGCVIDQPVHMHKVVIGRNVTIGDGSSLLRAVIFDNVSIGSDVILRNTFVMDNVKISDHVTVGVNMEDDKERGLHIDEESGIVVVTHDI